MSFLATNSVASITASDGVSTSTDLKPTTIPTTMTTTAATSKITEVQETKQGITIFSSFESAIQPPVSLLSHPSLLPDQSLSADFSPSTVEIPTELSEIFTSSDFMTLAAITIAVSSTGFETLVISASGQVGKLTSDANSSNTALVIILSVIGAVLTMAGVLFTLGLQLRRGRKEEFDNSCVKQVISSSPNSTDTLFKASLSGSSASLLELRILPQPLENTVKVINPRPFNSTQHQKQQHRYYHLPVFTPISPLVKRQSMQLTQISLDRQKLHEDLPQHSYRLPVITIDSLYDIE
ncbi:hypothetical protein HK100_002309 [Physocladia obscura]|uniref:Uncharacterized protein n=1 Tax=Physocladia obscura TaxID=109957 RepID=A0AAD5XFI5_9FUNG|nr:hypothetical protein HK100_002309 [Physocladia obscura]